MRGMLNSGGNLYFKVLCLICKEISVQMRIITFDYFTLKYAAEMRFGDLLRFLTLLGKLLS